MRQPSESLRIGETCPINLLQLCTQAIPFRFVGLVHGRYHLTRFDPIFGHFQRNIQILGLIRLELVEQKKIGLTTPDFSGRMIDYNAQLAYNVALAAAAGDGGRATGDTRRPKHVQTNVKLVGLRWTCYD